MENEARYINTSTIGEKTFHTFSWDANETPNLQRLTVWVEQPSDLPVGINVTRLDKHEFTVQITHGEMPEKELPPRINTLQAVIQTGLSDSSLSRLAASGELSQWIDPVDKRRRLYDREEIKELAKKLETPERSN